MVRGAEEWVECLWEWGGGGGGEGGRGNISSDSSGHFLSPAPPLVVD